MQLTVRHVYQTTDTALVVVDWSMKGKTPDGKTMDLAGSGTDVLRKGADGTWRYIIDNPFGSARPAQ
jgi:ketosteroid isomerase-like protein